MFECSNTGMVDMHGLSVAEAEKVVNYWLISASRISYQRIRFVTGRGNHINAKGERGTLYKCFLSWIEQSPYKDRIARCEQHEGFFEVHFKLTAQLKPQTDFFKQSFENFLSSRTKEIKEEAEKGEAYFQLIYGKLLEEGKYCKQDFKQAAHFYRLAADQKFAPAMHHVSRCYLHGLGVKQSDIDAYEWLKKADELHYVESTISLGDCYWNGLGVIQDLRRAVTLYTKAAIQQHPLAMRKVASAYGDGAGVEKSAQKSFHWYKRSADLGDTISQYNVAVMYQRGSGVTQSDEAAFPYFKLAAEGGDPDAQFSLGLCYLVGEKGVTKDKKQAMMWLEKASANGSSQANHLLAQIADPKDSKKYLERSAQSGNFLDKVNWQLQKDNIQNPTNEQFIAILQKSVKESFHLNANDIALLEHESKFLLIDTMLTEGKQKYKLKAYDVICHMADQNCIFSLRRLALFALNGYEPLKIKKDIKQALDYINKGILQQDSKAMVLLGLLYMEGKEITKSIDDAFTLFKNASKYDNPEAYYYLGCLNLGKLFKNADLTQAKSCFEKVILLEQEDDIALRFSSGLLDKFESMSENTAQILACLNQSPSSSLKP